MLELSAQEARRIAIAAQGLSTPRPASVDHKALRGMIERLGVVQIDSVNVLARSHYLPGWSRLGAYDHAAQDRLSHRGPRSVFEYWGHEASLLPVALHPLLRWRMARAGEVAWRHVKRISRRRAFVNAVLAIVAERGPITAGQLEVGKLGKKGWWEWSEAKAAIEWLFWSGQVTSSARRNFERLYDLPERVLPAAVLAVPTPREADAQRALIERAAGALGVATANDLRDYYRIKPKAAAPAIAALVEDGVLEHARVEGWKKPAYVTRRLPKHAIDPTRGTLLSPFDSLIWYRDRTARLFGMTVKLEIYTPAEQRVHGYYVLPFLYGDALVARVDLKADRAAGVLRVQAAHREAHATPEATTALAGELRAMAAWLGLARVEVVARGDLAAPLARAVGIQSP